MVRMTVNLNPRKRGSNCAALWQLTIWIKTVIHILYFNCFLQVLCALSVFCVNIMKLIFTVKYSCFVDPIAD